jgi:hypothetical protein
MPPQSLARRCLAGLQLVTRHSRFLRSSCRPIARTPLSLFASSSTDERLEKLGCTSRSLDKRRGSERICLPLLRPAPQSVRVAPPPSANSTRSRWPSWRSLLYQLHCNPPARRAVIRTERSCRPPSVHHSSRPLNPSSSRARRSSFLRCHPSMLAQRKSTEGHTSCQLYRNMVTRYLRSLLKRVS